MRASPYNERVNGETATGGQGWRPVVGVAIAVLAVSFAAVLARLCVGSLHPLAVAFWRNAFAALILVPWAWAAWRRGPRGPVPWPAVAAGVFLGIHFALWIPSLWLTSVGSSVLLVATQPLFVLLVSPRLLGVATTRRNVASFALALIGCAVLGWGDFRVDPSALAGDLLALGGAVAAAAYLLVGKRQTGRVELVRYLLVVYGTAALTLALLTAALAPSFLPEQRITWVWLLLLALGPSLVGHSLLNWSLRHTTVYRVNLAVLMEPVLASVWAWVFLAEAPTGYLLVGGALVLGSLAVEFVSLGRAAAVASVVGGEE